LYNVLAVDGWVAAGTTFLASALEFVEAATIVLAVGNAVDWRTALRGTGWALLALAALTGLLGPALVSYVPLSVLKIVIGIFLILFGYTWLRKAIWRYSGRKPMRSEQAAYGAEVATLRKHPDERRFGFATAFNGVLLEGLEVVAIVIAFSADRPGTLVWAAGGALMAGLLVAFAAVILRHPLSKVPENAMGFIVGIMLLSFGTFWSGEGLGLQWWAGEATLLWIIALYFVASLLLIGACRRPVRV
jgi:Ca2+/H+ antiporter, TMEM165/GDT1 family